MNTRLNGLFLSGSLALSFFMAKPALADEWNKRTEFQFSAPVEIPGIVLAPGKYVFQLADSDSDRNIVQVLSEDSSGNETLVATIVAISDYTSNPSDKPAINFEERRSNTPEAIHSWFYPGDVIGWEFVYPKEQSLEASAISTPAPVPVATEAAPALPPAPQLQAEEPPSETTALAKYEGEASIALSDAPASPVQSVQEPDTQNTTGQVLPETGGYSDLELILGPALLGFGIVALCASRRKAVA